MTPDEALTTIVRPVVERLGGSHAKEALLLVIGMMESGFADRASDAEDGTGFWRLRKQDLRDVLQDPLTGPHARMLCDEHQLGSVPTAPWQFFAYAEGDELACAFAAMKLPAALPEAEVRCWREALARYKWDWRKDAVSDAEFYMNWQRAVMAVTGEEAVEAVDAPEPEMTLVTVDADGVRAKKVKIEQLLEELRERINDL